jgi:DNA-binding NarL/FixJ family response regulator
MSYVLALVDNLFFQARIQAVAKQIAVEVKVAATGEDLVTQALANPPALVIVDLNAKSGPLDAVRRLREAETPALIIGYLSHVQTDLAAEGAAAGCSQVMPQGKFTQELPMILARARGKFEKKSL